MTCGHGRVDIVHTTWEGEPAVRFTAGGYEALLVPGVGANLIELKDPARGLDILRTPPDGAAFKTIPQVYGIPILFPPNRIQDGTFAAAGRVYRFPINEPKMNNHIHGFLHTRPWMVKRTAVPSPDVAEVLAAFCADSATDFFTYFPHEFEIQILYRLSVAGLAQTISVINHGRSPMPMGLGLHTAFRIPFRADGRDSDYRLMASIGRRWELNGRILPTGRIVPLDEMEKCYREDGVPPVGHSISAHYTVEPLRIGCREFHGAVIEDRARRLRLLYAVGPGYKHWMLWNHLGDKGFVCAEPQTWVIDAPNIDLPPELTGFKLLRPGEEWSDSCSISVQDY